MFLAITKQQADELLTQAYETYQKRLTSFCRSRLREFGDFTDDCVQKAFLFYYDKLLEGEEILNVGAYLYRVADNVCKDEYSRNIRREMKSADIEDAENIADPLQELERERAADLDYDELAKLLISKLTDEEQELFRLKYVERMSLEEIGELMNLRANTVAKRTSRLRTKIKELVTPVLENHSEGGDRYVNKA